MFIKDQLVAAFGILVLGVGGFAVSGETATRQCASEECACEEALRQNTIEALENFLRKYPQAVDGNTACAALGVPSEEEGTSSQRSDDKRTPLQSEGPPYGG
jgi:hypothetical protein